MSNAGVILTSTLWNQSGAIYISIDGTQTRLPDEYTYNMYCPTIGGASNASHAVTGCSNTADSQILYYWLEKGYDLSLSVSASDYFYLDGNSTAIYLSESPTHGEASISQINNLLSGDLSKKLQNGDFIAALNFYCGAKNHSEYGSSTSTTWWVTTHNNGSNAKAFKACGFDSYFFIAAASTDSRALRIFTDGVLNETGYSILRENFDYGEIVRVGVPGHAIYMDGYRYNSETSEYEYHLNYGWGTSSGSSKWYTVSQLEELEITYVSIDLSPDIKVNVTNDSNEYYGGSFLRGVERINNIQNDKSTTFSFDEKLAGKSIKMTSKVEFTSQVDLQFVNFCVDFQSTAKTALYSLRNMDFDINGGSITVKTPAQGAVAVKAGKIVAELNNGWLYTGKWNKLDEIGKTIKDAEGLDVSEFAADFLASISGKTLEGGNENDVLKLTNGSAVFGDVDLGGGENSITVENGSVIYGTLLGSESSIDLNIVIKNEQYTSAVIVADDADKESNLLSVTGGVINVSITKEGVLSGIYTLVDGYSDSVMDDFTVKVSTVSGDSFELNAANAQSDYLSLTVMDGDLILLCDKQDLVKIYAADDLIYSGLEYQGALNAGESMYVYFDGKVEQSQLAGEAYVYAGGNSVDNQVLEGGMLAVYKNGSAVDTEITSGGAMAVSSGGAAENTNVAFGGMLEVFDGGAAGNTEVASGGVMNVLDGGVANSATVSSGGSVYIAADGQATDLTLKAGGIFGKFAFGEDKSFDNIISGSAALGENAAIVGDNMIVSNGGVANTAIVNSGGCVMVSDGGMVSSTTVNEGGSMFVSSAGVAEVTEIASGAEMFVYDGGSASSTIVDNGGNIFIDKGGMVTDLTLNSGGFLGNFAFGEDKYFAEIANGSAVVGENAVIIDNYMNISGGVVSDVFMRENCKIYVYDGEAEGITMNTSCYTSVFSGGSLEGAVVNQGGRIDLYNGGEAENIVVSSGGSMRIFNGGVQRGSLQIESGAVVSAYTGAIIEFDISDRSSADDYLINDLSLIYGAPTYTVTVSDNQEFGTYKLAQGADNFSSTISVTDTDMLLSANGKAGFANNIAYTLTENNGDLCLTIEKAIADLSVITFKGASAVAVNLDYTINFTVMNDSGASTEASKLYIVCDGVKIGEVDVDAIAAGGSYSGAYTIAAGTLSEGAHRIRLVADGDDVIAESNEANNGYTRTIEVTEAVNTDLAVTTFKGDAEVASNQNYVISFAIKNNGTEDAAASKLYITCDGEVLGEVDVDAIAAGETYKGSCVIAGNTLSEGSHRIRLVADGAGVITETNEDNNGYTRSITVTEATAGDFSVNVFRGVSSFAANQDYTITFNVQNTGVDAVASSKLYILCDGVVIGETNVDAIAAGGNYTGSYTIAGGTLSVGDHRVRLLADGSNAVAEANEDNNGYTRTLTATEPVDYDFEVIRFAAAETTMVNQDYTINFTVKNNGKDTTAASKLYVTCDGVKVAETTVGAITANGGVFKGSCTIAGGILSVGTHRIRLVADGDGVINESNENNNGYTRTINVVDSVSTVNSVFPQLSETGSLVFEEVLGSAVDTFEFELTQAGRVDLDMAFDNTEAVAEVKLFDVAGNEFALNEALTSVDELAVGCYQVAVSSTDDELKSKYSVELGIC